MSGERRVRHGEVARDEEERTCMQAPPKNLEDIRARLVIRRERQVYAQSSENTRHYDGTKDDVQGCARRHGGKRRKNSGELDFGQESFRGGSGGGCKCVGHLGVLRSVRAIGQL